MSGAEFIGLVCHEDSRPSKRPARFGVVVSASRGEMDGRGMV